MSEFQQDRVENQDVARQTIGKINARLESLEEDLAIQRKLKATEEERSHRESAFGVIRNHFPGFKVPLPASARDTYSRGIIDPDQAIRHFEHERDGLNAQKRAIMAFFTNLKQDDDEMQ